MTDRDWEALSRYVRWVANAMELRDWTLDLQRRPCDRGAIASIHPTFGRKVADIYFDEHFRTLVPEVQRHTVVHELIHCHLEPAANMVYKDLEEQLSKPADQIFWNGFNRQIEYGVDALANVIAAHMPLIEWPASDA